MYAENLPNECPPGDAKEQKLENVVRLVPGDSRDTITPDDFASFAALGQTRIQVDPCDLASCSLFTSIDCEAFVHARKFPKLRSLNIAFLNIDSNLGRSKTSRKGHIHFWMYRICDPVSCVIKVETTNAA